MNTRFKDVLPDLGYYYFAGRDPENGIEDGAIEFVGITFGENDECYAVYHKLSPEILRLPYEYCSIIPLDEFTAAPCVNGVPRPLYERVTDPITIRELEVFAKRLRKDRHKAART